MSLDSAQPPQVIADAGTRVRRVLLVFTITSVLLVSIGVGIVAADWPFWKRMLALVQLTDGGEWPEWMYTPVTRIQGRPVAFFPAAAPGARTISDAALDAAARYAEEQNSVALLVMHKGVVQLERYWQGMTSDQLFSGRAMSRSLVGLAYGFAVADGVLSLDDPAERFLSEWRDDPRGRITIRQLLQNQSGLEELTPDAVRVGQDANKLARWIRFGRSAFAKNTRLALGTDFGAAALSLDPWYPPGTRFAFSNANAQLAGLILERATGEDYERYVQRRLWEPVGAGVGEFYMDRDRGMPAVYCCFRATPRDFLRLGALLIDDGVSPPLDRLAGVTDPGPTQRGVQDEREKPGDEAGRRVLPAGWVRELTRTSTVQPLYGLQIWSGRAPAGLREMTSGSGQGMRHGEAFVAEDVIWMEGGGGRALWAIPSRQLVILRLGRGARGWDPSVLPNTLLRGLDATAASPVRLTGVPGS
jgi:CubicO group peptidase (beta-lactamase class C family)